MTNSLNTPAEALEYAYPLRVRQYSLRLGSGGEGKYRGGDGIIREIEVLTNAEVTLLSDRRQHQPYGLAGGKDSAPGKETIAGRRATGVIGTGKRIDPVSASLANALMIRCMDYNDIYWKQDPSHPSDIFPAAFAAASAPKAWQRIDRWSGART